jgi:hypothetical protein
MMMYHFINFDVFKTVFISLSGFVLRFHNLYVLFFCLPNRSVDIKKVPSTNKATFNCTLFTMTKAAQSRASVDRGSPIPWMTDPQTVCHTLMDRQVNELQAFEIQVLKVRLSQPSLVEHHTSP